MQSLTSGTTTYSHLAPRERNHHGGDQVAVWTQEIEISGSGSKVSKHHKPERHEGGQGGNDQSWLDRDDIDTLSVEGVFQMVYILPERLLALVRPAFDLVLQRIQSLKRCVQACGCKIMTPRYACNLAPGCISSEPTFAGLRKNKKKKTRGPKKRGPEKRKEKGFPLAKLDIA